MRLLCCALLLFACTASAADDGFKPMFGKSLDGWKAKKGGESFDGKTEAYKGRFKLADGVLSIDPKVKGDVTIETAREIKGDAVVRFEFKPGKGCNNDLFFRGQKFDIVPPNEKGKGGLAGVKIDDWNTLEIAVKGDDIEFLVNGKSARKAKVKGAGSAFGIRAEFGPIEIRNFRVKEG